MIREDRERLDRALGDIRREIASLPLRPDPGVDTVFTAGVGVVGAIVGVTGGMGLWSIPYAVILVIVWLVLRCVIVLAARG